MKINIEYFYLKNDVDTIELIFEDKQFYLEKGLHYEQYHYTTEQWLADAVKVYEDESQNDDVSRYIYVWKYFCPKLNRFKSCYQGSHQPLLKYNLK